MPAPAHPDAPSSPRDTVDLRADAGEVIELDSLALLNGQREIVIRHGDECYRLRHTRNDKLILTK